MAIDPTDPTGAAAPDDADTVTDRLLLAIGDAAGRDDVAWAGPPTPLRGGFSAQMWTVRLIATGDDAEGDSLAAAGLAGDLVARVLPASMVAAREIAVQRHMASLGYPTPLVRLWGAPGDHVDRFWMLMDFAPGAPLLADLSGAKALARLPRLATAVPDQLARHTAALHRVDAPELATRLDSTGDTAAGVARLEQMAASAGRDDAEAAARWLVDNRPPMPEGTAVWCHGDMHPLNVLAHPDGDTVVDWSNTGYTFPEYDLAYTHLLLSHPPLELPTALAPVMRRAGRYLGGRFLRTYEREAGRPVDPVQMRWCTAWHTLRILLELEELSQQAGPGGRVQHPYVTLAPHAAHALSTITGITVAAG